MIDKLKLPLYVHDRTVGGMSFIFDHDGQVVTNIHSENDQPAQQIVKAVNCHDDLLAALVKANYLIARCEPVVLGESDEGHEHRSIRAQIVAAIAKAEQD